MPRQRRVYVSGPLGEHLEPRYRELRHAILEHIPKLDFELAGFFARGSSAGPNWDAKARPH
jgi:hypothetical protein